MLKSTLYISRGFTKSLLSLHYMPTGAKSVRCMISAAELKGWIETLQPAYVDFPGRMAEDLKTNPAFEILSTPCIEHRSGGVYTTPYHPDKWSKNHPQEDDPGRDPLDQVIIETIENNEEMLAAVYAVSARTDITEVDKDTAIETALLSFYSSQSPVFHIWKSVIRAANWNLIRDHFILEE